MKRLLHNPILTSLGLVVAMATQLHAETARLSSETVEEDVRVIEVDAGKIKGPMTRMPQLCVGSGYAPLGLRADWQRHLKVAKEACDFEYVRFHAIFHDAMGIFNKEIPLDTIGSEYLSADGKPGLKGEYFNNVDFEGEPAFVRQDTTVDFAWGDSELGQGIGKDNYSVRWSGTLKAPATGFYKLGAVSDDGIRLYVDGKLVAEDWSIHGFQQTLGNVHLEKGRCYDIVLEYFEARSGAGVSLVWSLPSGDEANDNLYNWQYVDKLYDFLLDQGVKPFVELGFMPEALAGNKPGEGGRTTVFWYEGNVTPPESYEAWAHLIRSFVSHLIKRYGEEEVLNWYFEVWNEPNHPLFWTADLKEYLKLYDVTARAVKAVNPNLRVGGPATAGNGWVREILEFCETNNTPLDFIATHCYGVEWGFLDESGRAELTMSPNRNRIVDQVNEVRGWIEATKYAGLELHYTEWSSSYSSRDPVHDSYHSAAYILHKLKGTESVADSMSYWTFTDVFEEAGPGPTPFHGGFGLQNLQGLRKPSFYAYKYFNDLGDTEIECNDADAWAAKDGDNVQVLFWDFSVTKQDASNKVYFKRDLPAAATGKAVLEVDNLAAGKYELNVYKVGYRVNDVYTDFLAMGSPAAPTREQVAKLAARNDGAPIETTTIRIGNFEKFTKEFDLRENDVLLVTMARK
ncbi:MAG: PA14 domain-containing protein [Verrucomicrobiota bacterium]